MTGNYEGHDMTVLSVTEQEWQSTPPQIQLFVSQLVAEVNNRTFSVDSLIENRLRVYQHSLKPRHPRQVAIIAPSITSRLYKYARAIHRHGWEIVLITQEPVPFRDLSLFSRISCVPTPPEVLECCLGLSPTAYHVFTSWQFDLPTYLIASGLNPLIFDDYDIINGCAEKRSPSDDPPDRMFMMERFCLENADALTSRDGRILVAKRKVALRPRSLALCLDGALSQSCAEELRSAKRTDGIHTVYAGNMADPNSREPRNFHFELAGVLGRRGIHYHIYPSHKNTYDSYRPLVERFGRENNIQSYFHLHEPVPADRLVQELSQYHFAINILTTSIGRVPGDHPFYNLDNSEYGMDNKSFDYISAGLFSFSYGGRWIKRIVHRYNLGMRVSSLEQIAEEAVKRHGTPFPSIPKVLTTDYWAERLIKLYQNVSR